MNKKGQPTETSNFEIPITTSTGKIIRVVPYETALRFEQQRDELREKYDTLAVEDMLDIHKICKERDELRDVLEELSLYLSVGMGDETTTAKQYKERILEGIKMLTDPLMGRIQEAEKMLDLQTKIVVDLEKRLMQ